MIKLFDHMLGEMRRLGETTYCLESATVDGTCDDPSRTCDEVFMNELKGSSSMAKDCQCQMLSKNSRRCTCCINCNVAINMTPSKQCNM